MQHLEHDQPAPTGGVYQAPVVQRLGTLAELTLGGGAEEPDATGLGSSIGQP